MLDKETIAMELTRFHLSKNGIDFSLEDDKSIAEAAQIFQNTYATILKALKTKNKVQVIRRKRLGL